MGYLIYENDSTRIVGKSYKTMAAAKAALTRMSKKHFNQKLNQPKYHWVHNTEDPMFAYSIAESGYYAQKIEKQVKRTNMMTGKEYYESVNPPAYMSPACESYWSM